VAYDLREWAGERDGGLVQVLHQEGAFGLDQVPARSTRRNPFPSIGTLKTQGALITLPYCWFSSLDTWDNPSLCAADSYSVAGDSLTFRSRVYNRPDLVPIARVSEHIKNHDYPAIRAWCSSSRIARQLLHLPSGFGASGVLDVTRLSPTRERVDLGDGHRFEVQKLSNHWVISELQP
jgi:hypothetical protein